MPHDVVLDPTVHHLFAKDRFNRGKSSRSWPLYPRCGHDLSPPRCPPFVEAGTPDLLWLYKSQRKAWKRGGKPEEKPREQGTRNQRRKQGGLDRKPGGGGTKHKSPSSQSSSQSSETSDEWKEERNREDGGEQELGCYASSSSLECKQIKTEELLALISSAARLQLHHTKSVAAKEARPEEQKGSLKRVLC